MRTEPGPTRSPEATEIDVTWPGTCGCTWTDRRDLSTATYDVASAIGWSCTVAISTGMGGGPPAPPCCDAADERHAANASTSHHACILPGTGRTYGARRGAA